MTNPTLLGTGGHTATSIYDAGTYYNNVGLGRCPMHAGRFTTESYASQTIRVPGTISYLSWGLDAEFGAALTLTLNKNSSSTALAVSFGASTTGWLTDSTNADDVRVSSGDHLDFAANVASRTTPSIDFHCISARFDADTASAQMLATVGWTVISPSTTPQFANFLGILGQGIETESDQQFICLAAGTWQNMACNVESNVFTSNTMIRNRVNNSNGSMAIEIPAYSSGYFEDTTILHKDSVSSGDLLDYEIASTTNSGSGHFTMYWIGAHLVATESDQCMIGGTPPVPGNNTVNAPEVFTSSLFGGGGSYENDTARATGLFPYALSASKFTNYITDVSETTSAATFTVLKNGSASSTLVVSSGAGETGYFTTANSETETFDVNHTCANQIQGSGAPGTSVTWGGAALLLTAWA